MANIGRRDFIKGLGIAGAAASIASVPAFLTPRRAQAQAPSTIGTVLQIRRGPVTLHTYVAPAASFGVTAHIIETANSLVVVDAQLLQTFSRDLRTYADSLGKPIERIILSHEHPDHWMGANNFSDATFFASANTISNVNGAIEGGTVAAVASLIGEAEVPEQAYAPTEVLSAGSETIDGVAFEYSLYNNHESVESIVIGLPEANTLIVQDLLYNNMHFFPGMERDNWISILNDLRGSEGYNMLLAGHGYPTTFGELDSAIDYLSFVQETLPNIGSADELIGILTEEYASFEGGGILDFWRQFLPAS